MPNKSQIVANCTMSSGYQGDGVININAKRLFRLLDSTRLARGELGRTAAAVLREMERASWQIRAGIHGGGLGGGGRGADPRQHITLRTSRSTYHLRFHSSGDRLIEISG